MMLPVNVYRIRSSLLLREFWDIYEYENKYYSSAVGRLVSYRSGIGLSIRCPNTDWDFLGTEHKDILYETYS